MKVTILGFGNVGQRFAEMFLRADCEVSVGVKKRSR